MMKMYGKAKMETMYSINIALYISCITARRFSGDVARVGVEQDYDSSAVRE